MTGARPLPRIAMPSDVGFSWGSGVALPLAKAIALAVLAVARYAHADGTHPAVEQVRVIEDATLPGRGGKTFTATTLMSASVPRLCAIVQDYASYGSYMPNTRSAHQVGSGDGYVLVDMTLDLPLGQQKQYRLRLEPSAAADAAQCRLSWKLIPRADLKPSETIADTSGYWLFRPAPGGGSPAGPGIGERTLVEYHVHADPGPVPFGFGWIVDLMSKRSLPRTLEALRTRAAQ